MQLCISNHRSTHCLDGLHHLILCLRVWPYLGLQERRIILTQCLHPLYGASGICPFSLFCFTGCIPNALDFRRKLEESTSLLRVPIFDPLCLTFFRRQFQTSLQILSHSQFPLQFLMFSFLQIFLVFSNIVAGLLFPPDLIWQIFCTVDCQKMLPVFLGLENFRGTDLHLRAMTWE